MRRRYDDGMTSADAPVACKSADTAYVFDEVIHLSAHIGTSHHNKEDSKRLTAFTVEAKRLCGDCPMRLACLDQWGRDYRLGVIGGLTDAERIRLFEAAS